MTVTLGTVLSALCYPFFTAFAGGDPVDGPTRVVWQQAMWHFSATLFCSAFWRSMSRLLSRLRGGAYGTASVDAVCCRSIICLSAGAAWRGLWELSRRSVSVEQDLSRPRANDTAITASETPGKSPPKPYRRKPLRPDATTGFRPPPIEAGDRADDQRAAKSRHRTFGGAPAPRATHFGSCPTAKWSYQNDQPSGTGTR